MTTDLREKIAEVLAGHQRPYTGSQSCGCGAVFRATGYDSDTVWAHRRHVAEAILAAIGEPKPEVVHIEQRYRQPVEPCPEGFRWIGQTWAACEVCGLPAAEHAGMAVPAWPPTSPFDDPPDVLRPWNNIERVKLGLPVATEDPRRALTEGQTDG